MNQPIDLNPIKARALAATTDIGTALERAKAAAEFRHHAAADVLRLVEEVERLRVDASMLDWLESQIKKCFGLCSWYKELGDVHLHKKTLREALAEAMRISRERIGD